MAFVPQDARWYVADIVLEIVVEGDPRNVVHTNLCLIEAASPEQAYEKALALGRDAEQTYANPAGKQVRAAFRGLADLNVIHDELEDGAELAFSEDVGVPETELRGRIRPKEQLGVFAPERTMNPVPNYMPGSVMRALEKAGVSAKDLEQLHQARPGEPE